MGLAGRTSALLGIFALLVVTAFAGCENPFSPLDKSSKIEGLSYIDFTLTWDRWDSDPEYDGLLISLDYKNEFGDGLSFHDKPHPIVIEFWTQVETGPEDAIYKTRGRLFFSKTVEYSNSEDDIRIPVEAYFGTLQGAGFDLNSDEGAKGFLVLRVFPPEEYPRTELVVAQPDIVFYKRPTGDDVPNQ